MATTTRARLRTKTGCLPCRRRRKKCDERAPICGACCSSCRECQWPTPKDLIDGRFTSHGRERLPRIKEYESSEATTGLTLFKNSRAPKIAGTSPSTPSLLTLLSESAAAHGIITRDTELSLSRHFSHRYFSLLILRNCHTAFHDTWLAEIHELMATHRSLYYSVLTCAAGHAHFAHASPRMRDLALRYYTTALGELGALLAGAPPGLEGHNALLMSVMLLYLHGCHGSGSYADVPQHLEAAARIIGLRLLREGAVVRCLFERLAVESVLFQIFLVTTGLWSTGGGSSYKFDAAFWGSAEELLERAMFFPGCSMSFNSPVLGVPVQLFRLTLGLSEVCHGRTGPDLEELRSEVGAWEAALLTEAEGESDVGKEAFYRDTSCLFALIDSIMLEHLTRCGPGAGLPRASAESSWQVRRALGILGRRRGDDAWSVSYLGNWPVYALGFFLDEPDEREVVRRELERRWELTRFTQILRFVEDLEKAWAERDGGLGRREHW